MALWKYCWFMWCCVAAGVTRDVKTDNEITLQNDLREFVEHTMACRNIPGLTLSAVRWNTTVMAEGYGQRDATLPLQDPRANVTSKTRFMIGSLSKAVTATLMAKLIGDLKGTSREVSWDTPLIDIIGDDFRLYDDVRTNQTTIKDLLSHRLGYPSYNGPVRVGLDTSHSRLEYCKRMFTLKPVLGFRDRYAYNNHMYTLAGCVAEVLGGDTYENLVEKHLLRPLGMNDSGNTNTEMQRSENFALPYVLNQNASGYIELDQLTLGLYPAEPAGAVYSTGEDMSRWMKMLVAEGRWNGEQLVDRTQLFQTWTPTSATWWSDPLTYFPMFPFSSTNHNYGLGWFLGTYKGYRRYLHTGAVSGYISRITILPDIGIGIFSAVNCGGNLDANVATRMIHAYVTDRLLGHSPWLNLSTACTFPEPWISPDVTRSAITSQSRVGKRRGHRSYFGLEPEEDPQHEVIPQTAETEVDPQYSGKVSDLQYLQSEEDFKCLQNEIASELRIQDAVLRDLWYDRYTGLYGHLMFGNASIHYNSTTNDLRLFVGRFGSGVLERTEREVFNVIFYGPAWYYHGTGLRPRRRIPLEFRELDAGKFQQLVLTGFEPLAPPVYVRGRKWTDVNKPPVGSAATQIGCPEKKCLTIILLLIVLYMFSF